MTTELSTKYDPSSVESQAYRVWLEEKCFHADPQKPGEPYCIVIPPPNVTGALHLGHAINSTLQDILIRQHRMRGFNTLWIPGIDHAGIATQAVVEKQLKEQENKTRHDVGREGLVQRIWAWKEQYGNRILQQLQRLGASCDWDRTRFTLDDMCARAVRETFFKLFKDGLIYRGKRLVNWDTFLQTSISDDEIYHETVKTSLWHIRYPIKGLRTEDCGLSKDQTPSATQSSVLSPQSSPTYMTVATTRPETMLGDTAVAVHSADPRWNWAIGKFVKLPLTGRLIPIIADDILVDPKFGTGVVKVTPAHDSNDYAVWQRHKGQPDEIDLINILTPDGKIVDDPRWQKYAGMKREAARKQVVEDLEAEGLLEKEEPYETQVGHSDRSKTPIEPYLSDQWFVKMAPLAEPALQVVRDGIIKFFPDRYAQTYLAWLGEKRDWPISRQLWWGHRIPVWHKVRLAETANDERLAFELLPRWREEGRAHYGERPYDRAESRDKKLSHSFVCVRDPADKEVISALERDGLFVQDPDVLDTWFSSALWPHSTLGWPEDTPELRKYYPTSVLVTGRDIITLWVARMVMTGMYNMGERSQEAGARSQKEDDAGTRGQGDAGTVAQAASSSLSPQSSVLSPQRLGIPFHHVAINPTILDGKGERMSKSKGNGVDPVDIIDSYGADALRFTLTKMATETQDARMPVKKDASGKNTSEKFDEGRNFCNKLWNACRFALANLEGDGGEARRHEGTEARRDDGETQTRRDIGNSVLASAPTQSSVLSPQSSPDPRPVGSALADAVSQSGQSARSHPSASAKADPTDAPDQSQIANRKSQIFSVDESRWSLADRWIVSRFNRTLDEVNGALENYRFDVYAKSCYDFFWRDFCDWYVEAIKPALKDPARREQTAHVLASVLDGVLRLMHPMIPFITETVWWRLNEVRPTRGLPSRLECPPSKRLINAPWPSVGDFSEASEHIFPRLQELIVAIRNIRNEHQVNPRQILTVHIRAGAEPMRQITTNREMIELLATCTIKDVRADLPPVPNAATATAAGCEIFVEGLVNADAEKQRLTKTAEETRKKIDAMKGRLSNESYISKAPANLVQQTRDQLAALEAEMGKITDALQKIG